MTAGSEVYAAGYLFFISLILTLSCITVYIGKESGMLIHTGRNGRGRSEGEAEGEQVLKWL